MAILGMIAGFALLALGAELLVRGASRLAATLGITPLVVGLTVVAFGTSAPEMAVSVASGLKGQTELAVANVVGSNICNILFILGLSALLTPLSVSRQLVRLDVPVMITATLLAVLMALDGWIGRAEGLVLFLALLAYTGFLVRQARREGPPGAGDAFDLTYGHPPRRGWKGHLLNGALVLTGLLLLVAGSEALVAGAVAIATRLGVSERVVGLTIVALGTSLPEVATSVVASLRGERDIAVGNIVGSNLFNLLGVLGLSALVTGQGLPVPEAARAVDMPLMLAASVACLPVFFSGWRITRLEGAVFLATYLAYLAWLVLAALQHPLAAGLGLGLLALGAPLAVLVVGGCLWRERRLHRT